MEALIEGKYVVFHALALDGYKNPSQFAAINPDDCFLHFLPSTINPLHQLNFFERPSYHRFRLIHQCRHACS